MDVTQMSFEAAVGRPFDPADTRPDPGRPVEGKSNASAPEASRIAGHHAQYRIGSQKARVLEALKAAGDRGLTAAEAAPVISRSRNQAATRLLELREDDWARPTDRTRPTGDDPRFKGVVYVYNGEASDG